MNFHKNLLFPVCLVMAALLLAGCGDSAAETAGPSTPPSDSVEPVIIDGMALVLLESHVNANIERLPESEGGFGVLSARALAPKIFLEVVVSLKGEEEALNWGMRNLKVERSGDVYEPEHTRLWVDEDSGSLKCSFIYTVIRVDDYSEYCLQLPDGRSIPLEPSSGQIYFQR